MIATQDWAELNQLASNLPAETDEISEAIENRQAWLWVALTPLVTFFEVALTRYTQAAQSLLGENFGGVLNSDRHGAYNWVNLSRRQLCWAHLRREFIKISERPGVSPELGEALIKQQEQLFELWHRVRDGTLTLTMR